MQPTDLTGPDAYMQGLIAFADPIVPGSVLELGAVGDEHNALVLLDLEVAGGPFGGGVHAPCARLYQVDLQDHHRADRLLCRRQLTGPLLSAPAVDAGAGGVSAKPLAWR
jgi:hypothetical protein